jgi:hypothetical protein
MNEFPAYDATHEETMQLSCRSLPEDNRRRYAAVDALKIGNEGVPHVAWVSGMSRRTINTGIRELEGMGDGDRDHPQRPVAISSGYVVAAAGAPADARRRAALGGDAARGAASAQRRQPDGCEPALHRPEAHAIDAGAARAGRDELLQHRVRLAGAGWLSPPCPALAADDRRC